MSRATELVKIDDAIKRCQEDAKKARDRLITLTGSSGIDGLAALAGGSLWVEVQSAFGEFEFCCSRAAELVAEKRAVTTA